MDLSLATLFIEQPLDSTTSTELLYFEDLAVDHCWVSPSREISEEDVQEFAILTGDHDPLHVDGGDSPFGRPIAHGLLGLSILAGLSTDYPRVSTLALTGIQDWQFEAPIFFGDVVRVVTTVVEAQPHGRRAGRIVWLRELMNQHDRVVQRGHFVSLVACRSRFSQSSKSLGIDPVDSPSQRGTLPAR